LLASALMPKSYNVEQSAIVGKPVTDVMQRVGDLNSYKQWNPWQQMDPGAKSTISGTPHTRGHQYAWEGKKIGAGSLTLQHEDAAHIQFLLEFIRPWKSKASDNWHFEAWGQGGETKVTWQNSGELPWPIARLMGPMISKNLNTQFQTGLENLKKMVEEG